MKKSILLVLFVSCLLVIIGCATKNPAYVSGNTNGIPQYVPDPRIAGVSNAVTGVTTVLAPAAGPYAPLINWGVPVIFGIVSAITGAVVTAKNKNAVIDTLAAGVVKAGPVAAQAVTDHASTLPTFTAVVDAINANTGANQTTTGAPKTT